MNEFRVTLPFPPSVNTLFPTDRRTGRRFTSPRYKAWKREAWVMIKQARVPKITGFVAIEIELTPKDNRVRDADNYAKAVIDSLVQNGILADDSSRIVRSAKVTIGPVDQKNAKAVVIIRGWLS